MSNYKKFRKSKAFTIVELVIVIAIVAILAAVLIPTFVNVAKEAKVTADKTMVKNLNTALAVDEAVNGKAKTCYDALEVAKESGYSADKLTPVSSGDILWDSASNRFLLVDNGNLVYKDDSTQNESGVEVWKMIDSLDQANGAITENSSSTYSLAKTRLTTAYADSNNLTYSYYLKGGFVATSLTVKGVGIDVGDNDKILSIKYQSDPQNSNTQVVVRTNGGSLSVESGSVVHCGEISSVDVSGGKYTMENLTIEYLIIPESSSANVTYTDNVSLQIYANYSNNSTSINLPESATAITDSEIVKVENGVVTYKQFDGSYGNVLQLGTESYPYIVNTAAFVSIPTKLQKMTNDSSATYVFSLSEDVTIEKSYNSSSKSIKSNIVFDLNGKSLKLDYKATMNFGTEDDAASLIIKNGSIDILENEYTRVQDKNGEHGDNYIGVYGDVLFDHVTINGVDVSDNANSTVSTEAEMHLMSELLKINKGGNMYFNDCTVNNTSFCYEYDEDSSKSNSAFNIKVTNSTFNAVNSIFALELTNANGTISIDNSSFNLNAYNYGAAVIDVVSAEDSSVNIQLNKNTLNGQNRSFTATIANQNQDTSGTISTFRGKVEKVTTCTYKGTSEDSGLPLYDVKTVSKYYVKMVAYDSQGITINETNCTYNIATK